MMKICRYEIIPCNKVVIDLPIGTRPLSVGSQRELASGSIQLWCLVPMNQPVTEPTTFRIASVGHPLDYVTDDLEFIGTVLMANGSLVFHVFMVNQ